MLKKIIKHKEVFESMSTSEMASYDQSKLDDTSKSVAFIVEWINKTENITLHDNQIKAGLRMIDNYLIELNTGEGKTLTALIPMWVSFLRDETVHVITANEYLAKRDSEYSYNILNQLGVKVNYNDPNVSIEGKDEIYGSHVSYGTISTYAFDYLSRNLLPYNSNKFQIKRNLIILDEADSILIDEAKTPMVISGIAKKKRFISSFYPEINDFVKVLKGTDLLKGSLYREFIVDQDKDYDYLYDRDTKEVFLTNRGMFLFKEVVGPFKSEDEEVLATHFLNQSLRAHYAFNINDDYIVENDKVVIVDTNTGRSMPDRTFSDGLHEALEVKEGVDISESTSNKASITVKNYLQLYERITGMSGTLWITRKSLKKIYNLKTKKIKTNKKNIRVDNKYLIFNNNEEKIDWLMDKVKNNNSINIPTLIGTRTINDSEEISSKLKELNLNHFLLNAIKHDEEAGIIGDAGKLGAITVATNMAGRGTDIKLGGDPNRLTIKKMIKDNIEPFIAEKALEDYLLDYQKQSFVNRYANASLKETLVNKEEVIDKGGLDVIIYEPNNTERIDNQLRGRSGRQGEPGTTHSLASKDDFLLSTIKRNKVKPSKIKRLQGKMETQDYEIIKDKSDMDEADYDIMVKFYNYRDRVIEASDDDIINNTVNYIIKELKKISKSYKRKDRALFLKDTCKWYSINESVDIKDIKNLLIEKIKENNNLFKKRFRGDTFKQLIVYNMDVEWEMFLSYSQNLKDSLTLYQNGITEEDIAYKELVMNYFITMLTRIGELSVKSMTHANLTGGI